MMTIFTVPKQFVGHIGIIQRNAIQSWLRLRPACEIILFGDDAGTGEVAKEFGIRHIPDINRNEYGTPLLDSAFEQAEQYAGYNLMNYINSDIIIMNDFLKAVSQLSLDKYLMIGQRWDLDITELIDYNKPDWETSLRSITFEHGHLHPPSGVDYYLFSKGLFGKIPPFAIGRTTYDNWLIFKARFLDVPVIDATKIITSIHQNHERTYASVGLQGPSGETDLRKGIESKRNLELAGGNPCLFTLRDANWEFTPQGLRKIVSSQHLYQHVVKLPERSRNPLARIVGLGLSSIVFVLELLRKTKHFLARG